MYISIEKVKFKNFMSYQNEAEISFYQGSTLINSKNGAGKSSIIESVFYGLFGKPYRKINNGDLINDKTQKNLEVEVTFKIGNITYKVVRGQKPAKFEIYENDELIIQDSKSLDYQKMLEEKILRTNENIFRQLVLIGANIPSSKNFSELSNKEREDLFKYIIDIGIFGEYSDIAKSKIKEQKTEYQMTDSKLQQTVNLKNKLSSDIEKQEEQNSKFEENKKSRIQEQLLLIQSNQANLEKIELALTALVIQEPYTSFDQINILSQSVNHFNNEIAFCDQKLKMIEGLKKTHNGCIACDKLKDISGIDVNEEDTFFQKKLELTTKRNEAEKALIKLKEFKQEYDEKIKKKDTILLKKKEIENEIISAQEKIKLLEEMTPSEIDYSTLENIKEEEENLMQVKVQLENSIRDYATFVELLSDKNLKGQILDMSLPVINKYINYFLEKFGNFPYLFTINNDLTETIMTIDGSNVTKSFNSLSNGQKLRIVFSILFAFLKFTEERNASHFNLLFLDEVLDSSIDTDGRVELINILRSEFSDKSISIISHTQDLQEAEELFDRIYTVDRTENGSKIIQLKGNE